MTSPQPKLGGFRTLFQKQYFVMLPATRLWSIDCRNESNLKLTTLIKIYAALEKITNDAFEQIDFPP